MTSISLAKKQKKITRFISSSYRKHTRKKYSANKIINETKGNNKQVKIKYFDIVTSKPAARVNGRRLQTVFFPTQAKLVTNSSQFL